MSKTRHLRLRDVTRCRVSCHNTDVVVVAVVVVTVVVATVSVRRCLGSKIFHSRVETVSFVSNTFRRYTSVVQL